MEKFKAINGVMFNAYPDSIGVKLADTIELLKRPEFKDVFSLFYILPTIFNSDLDRGFSIIDYDLNQQLVSENDLAELKKLNILLKFDLVLNHLSVASPQFKDLLSKGEQSEFKDFFINWNEFWIGQGEVDSTGIVMPNPHNLQKLFMRKPGLPILMVRFPDGSERPYWNTFYNHISYDFLEVTELTNALNIPVVVAKRLVEIVNAALASKIKPDAIKYLELESYADMMTNFLESRRRYLGQMDLNAKSEQVWQFYSETLNKLKSYGAVLVRLDAFAYLHKQPGEVNFFNKPATWHYLDRLRQMADELGLLLLPEIHSEYGKNLHAEVAAENFPIYDFFFPGLVIDAIDRANGTYLCKWIKEIQEQGLCTINMLGCHDGIPVLDLKGVVGNSLLAEAEIDQIVERIIQRGGRVKNLYGPDGKKIAYYQVNATFYSALGESEQKLLLARALQLFTPGIPQVWYLDLFAGKNNYAAADADGVGSHKEINRTTLSLADIELGLKQPVVLKQLEMIRWRNTFPAFKGEMQLNISSKSKIAFIWTLEKYRAELLTDLDQCQYKINFYVQDNSVGQLTSTE